MSGAALMILISCLLVMGNFAALVYNINSNLDNLVINNKITCFVDTELDKDPVVENDRNYTIYLASSIVLNSEIVTTEKLYSMNSDIQNYENFVTIADASESLAYFAARMTEVSTEIATIYDETERNNQTLYLNALGAKYEKLKDRVDSLAAIDADLRAMNNVASVEFTSKATGLEEIKAQYSDYPAMFDNYKTNTLPDKFTITYKDNAGLISLKYDLEHYNGKLYKVICYTEVAERMESIRSGVIFVFGWLMIILLVVSVFVIVNTIKLSVYSRKNEIFVMRYVGATGWVIAMPFIFEGAIIGTLSAVISYFLEKLIYNYFTSVISENFANLIVIVPFDSIKGYMLIFFLAVGILTSVLGSFFSVSKYKKA